MQSVSVSIMQNPVPPGRVSLNEMIEEIVDLLRQVTVAPLKVRTQLDPRLNWIRAERRQVDRVLVHLAISAYDAMQPGGELAIRTANRDLAQPAANEMGLEPGPYSQIEFQVSQGDLDAQGAIFEIVRRSRGWASVRRIAEGGSAVTVLFPAITFANSTIGFFG